MAVTQTVTGPTREDRAGGIEVIATFETSDRLGVTETVSWISDPCTFPKAALGLCWEEPAFPADDKTGEPIDIEMGIGSPFALYGGVECFLGPDNDFDARARAILEDGDGRILEAKLVAWGAAAAAPIDGTDLVGALAAVENALDVNYLGRGVIIVNRGDAVRLGALHALEYRDGILYTINGTPVLSTGAAVAGQVIGVGSIKVLQTALAERSVTAHPTNREFSIAERVYAILVDCSYRVLATAGA